MKRNIPRLLWVLCVFCGLGAASFAQTGRITVDPNGGGHAISPTFYGLMTEEINHAYDGGLYGELIRDRNFLGRDFISVHWQITSKDGKATMALAGTEDDSVGPTSQYLTIDTTACAPGEDVQLSNNGFWGIALCPNTAYHAAVLVRSKNSLSGTLLLKLQSADGSNTWAQAEVKGIGPDWKVLKATLRTGDMPESANNLFAISISAPAQIDLAEASLFPPTYHNRANGNRADLMELLEGMKPSFLRLPGGNYLEGDTVDTRFDWKRTIGSIWQRPGHQGPWGYRSSDGLGLLEYLEWCEDLRMQPVLAVYAGYNLNGTHIDAGPTLAPYVQDALDEIEYVAGGTNTKWGAERAKDGHSRPFPLTYVEIGNEDAFDRAHTYDARFAQFYDAIKAKYPRLQLIATMPVTTRNADVVDEHYYRSPQQMAGDSGHYDHYDRSGPKVFVGEWASMKGSPTPNFSAALGDAAWLTGLERDSDIVVMESYAPLLVNVNPGAAQWPTNLIGYDALHSYGSPSYWVQRLFAKNTGDRTIPVKVDLNKAPTARPTFKGAIGVGTWGTQAEFKDIQVTQDGKDVFTSDFSEGQDTTHPKGWTLKGGDWSVVDGALRQTSSEDGCYAEIGDPNWQNYTIELKARKISGPEGFLILFHYGSPDSFRWWNVGGWGDTQTALEDRTPDGAIRNRPSDFKVETGRWYDLSIKLQDGSVRCYVDGNLVSQGRETMASVPPIYVAASRYGASGDVVLKVVNFGPTDQQLTIDLGSFQPRDGRAWEMAGDPSDENSIASPMKVAPKSILVQPGSTFNHTFPGHSVTVFRLSPG